MRRISHDLQGFAVLAVAVAVGAFILLRNAQPALHTVLSGTGGPVPAQQAGSDPGTLAGESPLPTPAIRSLCSGADYRAEHHADSDR
jgi:hypothetical protein